MARPRAVRTDPEQMTLADLRRALDQKERELRSLLARKEELADDLEELGETLQAMLAGSDAASNKSVERPAVSASPRRRGAARSNVGRAAPIVREGSLQAAIRSVLERVIGPLRIAEIVDAVLKSGYASKSENLSVIVCNRLAQMQDVEKVERGLYQLKRPDVVNATEPPPLANAATA